MKRGFTLVELLCVLAITAFLVSLTIAVTAGARERSRRSVCASNLHQWGQAFMMYVQDNDGIEPVKGVQMSHWKLGLPPHTDSQGFLTLYHLAPGPLAHCPSEHYPGGGGPHAVSYILSGFVDDDIIASYPSLVADRGPDLVLATCEMHNADTDFDNMPTWATKWVQSVHIDQSLRFHSVRASTSSDME